MKDKDVDEEDKEPLAWAMLLLIAGSVLGLAAVGWFVANVWRLFQGSS